MSTFLFAFGGLALAMCLFFLLNRNVFTGVDHSYHIDSPEGTLLPGEVLEQVEEKRTASHSESFLPFRETPSLIIWLLISSIGMAFASAMAYESWLIYKKLKRVFNAQLRGIALFIFFIVLAGVFLPTMLSSNYSHQLFPPILWFKLKLGVVTAVHAVAAGFCIVCLVLTGNLAFNLRKKMPELRTIDYYATLHQLQMRLVFMLGIQLTIGILATAMMREVHIELYGADQKFISKEGVAYYGIFYTFLIAVFFIPARRELIQFGYRIVDKECGKRPAEGRAWKDWMEERDVLVKLFRLEMSAKEFVEWSVPILAPLVTSILPEFLRASK